MKDDKLLSLNCRCTINRREHTVSVGDWVTTKYKTNSKGEKIYGWVKDIRETFINVRPVNYGFIETLPLKDWEIKPMDDFQPDDKDIRAMLEIAISTWDKSWFEELNKRAGNHPSVAK